MLWGLLGGRSSHTGAALLTLGHGAASLWQEEVQLNLALGIKLGLPDLKGLLTNRAMNKYLVVALPPNPLELQ